MEDIMRVIPIITMCLLVAFAAWAEDGELFVRDISKTPDFETDHATIQKLSVNVLAHNSQGDIIPVTYVDQEGATFQLEQTKPLVAFYHDGPVVHPEDAGGFPGHGERDVFGAVSFDDGATWKRSNLSRSADRSSFNVDGVPYPGDTFRLFAGSDGWINPETGAEEYYVLVAWAGRYAHSGNPLYSMDDESLADLAAFLGVETTDLYLRDMWGVSGSQRSSDFADEGFPTVGEVPYAALWCARGTLEFNETEGIYEVIFRQAERLTSAVRDVHRIEVAAEAGAGFVITWQEDPDGLRPGHGEGPGEGWSGAVAHHETDIWYSYIDWANFGFVQDPASETFAAIPLADYDQDTNGIPAAAVPFSIPVRLTDNAMGKAVPDGYDPLTDPSYLYELGTYEGYPDLCVSTVTMTIETPEGPEQTVEMCVTEDGRLLRGNTAATRCRVNLQSYDADGNGVDESAWVILAYEESKGLGEEEDLDPQELIEKVDMGKNIWYHTFDMRKPELVSQGLMLNQPAVYPMDLYEIYLGDRLTAMDVTATYRGTIDHQYTFMDIDPDPIYEDPEVISNPIETTLFQTEIARRFSLISQPAASAGESGVVAFAMWKQGIVRQGGPADVYARRFILPDDFDASVDNPYDYANMDCGTWLFADEDGDGVADDPNPRYVKGICASPPECMSCTNLVECEDGSDTCNETFPYNEYFDDLSLEQGIGIQKIYQWSQIGPDYGMTPTTTEETNFDDQQWENPFDLSKGHRGYMSGDYIMMLYCWSPNWQANTVGHDNYNLYVRRSFDGGETWTTLPGDFTDVTPLPEGVELTADGTSFYEWMGPAGGDTEYQVPYDLAAGQFEPSRNVSLLVGTRLTVLDPRYAPTALSIPIPDSDGFLYPDDERDPSKFFVTFEVGDNTTVEFGEATPLDMYYSRAFTYGDDYEVVEDTDADPTEENAFYFDWLENKRKFHAAEAALKASPGGMFFHAIWNQWQEDNHENVFDSDAILRRMMFLDEEVVDDGSGGDGGDDGDDGGDDDVWPPAHGRRK
jgi:hypothetical protein